MKSIYRKVDTQGEEIKKNLKQTTSLTRQTELSKGVRPKTTEVGTLQQSVKESGDIKDA